MVKRTPRSLLLIASWVVALALIGWLVRQHLVIGSDLRLFLPSPSTPEQRLLLEEIGEGPASRVLIIALGGAPPEQLADVSRNLVEQLAAGEQFRFVTNGELSLDAIPDNLLPYRYLLSPTLDSEVFDSRYLHAQLTARARDLASPAGAFLSDWLPLDPTLEMLKVLERWQPMQEPRREFDVWFDRTGQRALLLAETAAAAFDPQGQRLARDAIERALAESDAPAQLALAVSGTGMFSVMIEKRTRGDAQSLGAMASIGMILLLLAAYRRAGSVLLSALPLVSAGIAGLAVVGLLFGTVHGITLAFGFTLIGVAQDYPLHLLSQHRADCEPAVVARELWPTLATGIASTCIAYLTFLFSGVIGLAQLACFTVAGLAVAGLTTRFALPPLMDNAGRDVGDSLLLQRLGHIVARVPRLRWFAAALALACVPVIALAPQRFWENDLAKLTPVPPAALLEYQTLRAQIGTPDVRYLLVVEAPEIEQALSRLESLESALARLVAQGAVTGYDHAARYLPSVARQRQRQERLPDSATLRSALGTAQADTPFRPDVFEPFINQVEQARRLPPLTMQGLYESGLSANLQSLLMQRPAGTTALVTLSGVRDVPALRELAAAHSADVTLLDVKAASESLVADQRTRTLWCLAAAALLLVAVIGIALRSVRRAARVIAPMLLTTLVVLALLRASGVSLTLFHLIALILAAGLGLDYALFFEHAAADPAQQRRTLHAVLVCSLSTLMVFALLATSSLPVLRAIGVTVSLGVVCNFLFALLLTRARRVSDVAS